MKKTRILTILTALTILTSIIPIVNATNGVSTYPLYAGQDTPVGQIQVWNNADHIYVKYILDEPWLMTESHLLVADSAEDIPQMRGNPIPGRFDFKTEHMPYVSEWEYKVPRDWDPEDSVVIAAHAVVVSPCDEYEQVWQIGDVEERDQETGLLYNYADEFNWPEATPTSPGQSLAIVEPEFTDPFIVGTTPDSEFPYNSNYYRKYATDFDVEWDGYLPFGGKLVLSWSPGQSATEKKVISNGFTETLTAFGEPVTGEGWFYDKYPLVENEIIVPPTDPGTHTINMQHTQGDGTFWDWIRLEAPCLVEETAWAGEEDFPGRNWATYFTYEVTWTLLETVTVPATTSTPTDSTTVLESGKDYMIEVSGTYSFRDEDSPNGWLADAEYAYRKDYLGYPSDDLVWHKGDGDPYSDPYNGLDLCIDINENTDWGEFNEDHVYSIEYPGEGFALSYVIKDSAYSDNSGSLTVNIYG